MKKEVDQPRVSVVIPTYNRADKLRRCLESLKDQSINDFEVIVCDDGSTDNTSEVVKEYMHVLDIGYDYADNFGGPARPRNRGIKLARAPYIAFLDSDDWWLPQKLEESLKFLEAGADLVYHDLFFITKPKQSISGKKVHTRSLSSPIFNDLLENGNAITNSSVVLKKSLLFVIDGISEDKRFIAMEDYDAWLRIAKVTEKFQKIPQALGCYWGGGGNISNPERTLIYLDAFKERYSKALAGLKINGNPYWIDYAAGKAHMSLQSYAIAVDCFSLIHGKHVPFLVYVKSRGLLLLNKLYGLKC